jgi:capsular exopolysaccharide synthesis family protein
MSTSGAASTLLSEKRKAEAELAEQVKASQAFAVQHDIIGSASDRGALQAQTLSSIAASVMAANLDVVSTKSRLDEVRRGSVSGGDLDAITESEFADGSGVSGLKDDEAVRAQLIQAQATLAALSREWMPNHPLVRAARKSVDDLTVAHKRAVAAAYFAACKREKELKDFYASEQRRLVKQDAYAAEYGRMLAKVGQLEKLVDSLDDRMRELSVTDDGAMATVTVLEPARADERPTSPRRGRALGIGLMAGLMIGALAACVRDRLDTRITSAEQIRQHLGLVPMGVLPEMSTTVAPRARALHAFHNSHSPMADVCRELRTAILYNAGGEQVKTILIASPSEGEGRTTIASNLAISLAQAGRRVLLIDADLRNPMQDRMFRVEDAGGLGDLLGAGTFNPDEAARNIQQTLVPNLEILTSGGKRTNSAELFNSRVLTELLHWVGKEFDNVIIDTPPSRTDTDARIIASSCDATLLVLCRGKHNRNVVAQTCDDLVNVGARIFGVVLNQVPAKSDVTSEDESADFLPSENGPRPRKTVMSMSGRIAARQGPSVELPKAPTLG